MPTIKKLNVDIKTLTKKMDDELFDSIIFLGLEEDLIKRKIETHYNVTFNRIRDSLIFLECKGDMEYDSYRLCSFIDTLGEEFRYHEICSETGHRRYIRSKFRQTFPPITFTAFGVLSEQYNKFRSRIKPNLIRRSITPPNRVITHRDNVYLTRRGEYFKPYVQKQRISSDPCYVELTNLLPEKQDIRNLFYIPELNYIWKKFSNTN